MFNGLLINSKMLVAYSKLHSEPDSSSGTLGTGLGPRAFLKYVLNRRDVVIRKFNKTGYTAELSRVVGQEQ